MTKVAVIMSVYCSDSFDYVITAVESILSQSYKDITLFIYRDGPVSVELDDYIEKLSSNNVSVKYIKGEYNCGLAFSLNRLIDIVIEAGMYKYIARMDSDDISMRDRIYRQINYLSINKEIDVCGTSCKEFGATYSLEEKHLPETHAKLLDFSITRCPFIHPSVMFRTSIFESGIRYPTNTALTEDMALWFDLLYAGYKFSNINDVLLYYRLNESTIKRRKGIGKAISELRVRFKYMMLLERCSFKNVFLISARLVFHMLPSSLMKLAYKKAR